MSKDYKNSNKPENRKNNNKNLEKKYPNKEKELKNVNVEFDQDEEIEEYEEQIVELINDEGKIERLVLEVTFHLDDDQYAILREENSEEGMVYRLDKARNGELIFSMIEDEEELNEVIEIYEAMADELI